ncbi:MAG: hypothetical protein ACTSW1_03355 [Candidatus Hodarchaeales archaeon]
MDLISAGIDEAGRGSVFGPLVIAAVALKKNELQKIEGIKDSKLFSGYEARKKRIKIAKAIIKASPQYKIVKISAREINHTLSMRPVDNLNLLEIRKIAESILAVKVKVFKIDTISSPEYFRDQLKKYYQKTGKNYSYENHPSKVGIKFVIKEGEKIIKSVTIAKKGDRIFPIVSAASIVAKYARDKSLREIERQYGLPEWCLGYGYPNKNDGKIIDFLRKYRREIQKQEFDFIRYKWDWSPLKEILEPRSTSLDEFLK